MSDCYPVTLLIAGRPCLVVGGGRVAERKITDLLGAGARVTVISPEATDGIRKLADRGDVELLLREPVPADLDGAHLVIVATDDRDLNAELSARCRRRGLLVNVVDQPELCSFYVPATVNRGPVAISVSTGGASPALARRLRETIEDVVGEEYGALAELMGELRDRVRARWPRQEERAAAWRRLLESDALQLLREGQTEEARRLAEQLVGLRE